MKPSSIEALRDDLAETSRENERLRADVAEFRLVVEGREDEILKLQSERNAARDRVERQERDLDRRMLECDDAKKTLTAMQAELDLVREERDTIVAETMTSALSLERLREDLATAARAATKATIEVGYSRAYAVMLARLVKCKTQDAASCVADLILSMEAGNDPR